MWLFFSSKKVGVFYLKHWYLQAVPVPLCTLLLIGKIKARHANDVEERLADNPGRRVIDSPQTGF